MELKEGYKHTDVGVIPKDWEVKKLSQIGKFSKGQGVRKDDAQSGDIPCVRYGEIYTRHNDYIKQFYSYISKEIALTARKLKFGDILFAGSGETKEEIGKSVAFINNVEAFAGGDIVILSLVNHSPLFLGFLLNAPFIQKQKASRGQGDAVVHISATQLGNISIPIPKTQSEQTQIATALSDTEALISSLEKLIAKKRNIKQGAIQKLLKPKEGWVVKEIGTEIDLLTGFPFPSNRYSKSGIRLLRGSNVKRGVTNWNEDNVQYWEKITPELKPYLLNAGDIVIAMDGSLVGKSFARLTVSDLPSILLQRVARVRSSKIDLGYLKEFICSDIFTKHCDSVKTSSAIPHISPGDIRSFKIPIPPTLEEQIHIATILSDMDAEIAALETKLAKYRNIKLGMMQQLLTGKIRLV